MRQADDAAQRADRPAVAGNFAHLVRFGDIRQEGVVKDLRPAVADLGQDEEEHAR